MKLISNNGSRALVLYGGKHYIVSDNGGETLIFESDAKGNISQYVEVGGGRGATLLDVLGNFSFYLNIF